jgi:dethiobiotin synthetase
MCNFSYLLKHVLIECVDAFGVRQTFNNANTLSDVFKNLAGEAIFVRDMRYLLMSYNLLRVAVVQPYPLYLHVHIVSDYCLAPNEQVLS